MKKSLSLLLALAMVFGMFASMASAADPALTTEQKLQQLVDLKILKGKPDGKPHLEDNLTRAEFATIAIAVAGVAEDTTTASAFSDVKAGEWHTGAITAANKAGFVEGVGGGLFAPKATITVQEIVKVAAAIAKLKPVEGATVDGAAAWAAPSIKAAQDAGLPVPTNYTANATRGQTIDLAYAVYQALQVKPLSDAKAVVNADDTITVTGKTAGGVTGVKVAIGTAEAAAATLNADGTFTYTTAKQAVGDYKLTVTAYKGEASVASAELTAKIDGFTVSSVTVLNGKQLAVTFNKPVKEGIADGGFKHKNDAGEYYFSLQDQTVTANSDAAPSLSDDKKTVTITFNHFDPLDRYAQFKIAKGLKSASGQELGEFKQAVYLTDKTAPSVKGVSYSGKDAVIEFSEPLSKIGTVSIDGVEISEGTTNDSSIVYELDPNKDITTDFNKVKIHNLEVDTSYTIDIVAAQDIAGNYLNYNGTLKVTSDNTPPTVSSITVDGTTVSVKFSEALLNKAATLTVVDEDDYNVDSYDSDTNVAKFKLADIVGDKSFVSVQVYFKADSFQDLQGNPNKVTSKQTITLKADKTAPTFKSVSTDGHKIIVKYSEEINANGLTALDYKFSDDNGVSKNDALDFDAVVGYDANDDGDTEDSEEKYYLVITVNNNELHSGSSLKAGKYTISIPSGAIKDTSPAANSAAKVTLNFTVSSSSSKAIVKLKDVKQDTANHNKIIFEFDSKLNKSQFDSSKFLMAGSALPSATKFSFADDDQKFVVAELPSGTIGASGPRTFQVKGIVADNGNTMDTDNDTIKAVDLIENKAPVALSATLLDDQTISVSFSEALDTPTSFDGISIKINGNLQASDKIANVSADNKNLLIEVKDPNTFNADQKVEVIFEGADGVTDLAGNIAEDKTVQVK